MEEGGDVFVRDTGKGSSRLEFEDNIIVLEDSDGLLGGRKGGLEGEIGLGLKKKNLF